jgi:hypothetical protein
MTSRWRGSSGRCSRRATSQCWCSRTRRPLAPASRCGAAAPRCMRAGGCSRLAPGAGRRMRGRPRCRAPQAPAPAGAADSRIREAGSRRGGGPGGDGVLRPAAARGPGCHLPRTPPAVQVKHGELHEPTLSPPSPPPHTRAGGAGGAREEPLRLAQPLGQAAALHRPGLQASRSALPIPPPHPPFHCGSWAAGQPCQLPRCCWTALCCLVAGLPAMRPPALHPHI